MTIYLRRINPPKKHVKRHGLQNSTLLCLVNKNNGKEYVKNVLNFLRKDATTACLVSTVIIERTYINIFSDEMEQLFSCWMNF